MQTSATKVREAETEAPRETERERRGKEGGGVEKGAPSQGGFITSEARAY